MSTYDPARPLQAHIQYTAYVRVSVALTRAADQRDRLDTVRFELAYPEQLDPQTRERLERDHNAKRAAAEQRLASLPWSSPELLADRLTDAVAWASDSPLASTRLRALIDYYATNMGLHISKLPLTVTVDPEFRSATAQNYRGAHSDYTRAGAVVDAIAVQQRYLGLPEHLWHQLLTAVSEWRGTEPGPADAGTYLDGAAERRVQLTERLNELNLDPSIRQRVEFLVDYVRGQTEDVDLRWRTPILVDPAEEVRGRIGAMMARFAEHGDRVAAQIAEEIAVMSPADQETVRAIGRQIINGSTDVGTSPWPDYIDRDELAQLVHAFATDSRKLLENSEESVAFGELRGSDSVQYRFDKVREGRARIQDMLGRQGLEPIEVALVQAVVEDIDMGRIDDSNVPELLFVDERSKSHADLHRHAATADEIAIGAADAVHQAIQSKSGEASEASLQAVDRLHTDLDALANGQRTRAQVRPDLDTHRGELSRVLSDNGVGALTRTRIKVRSILDQAARDAARHGTSRAGIEQVWQRRLHPQSAEIPQELAPAMSHRAFPTAAATTAQSGRRRRRPAELALYQPPHRIGTDNELSS